MLKFITLTTLLFLALNSFSQTLIMNEVSQGITGNMEYVEFVVIDTTISYDCLSGVPPSIDIRGWIFDDNSGYHGAGGIASGAIRFSFDPMWAAVPLGTIILIYNNADPDPSIPAADISMSDGNCKIVAPISDINLFESNTTTPGAIACSYPAVGWTAGGNWNNTLLANAADCARIVNLAGCEVFSVCWGTNNLNTMIYFVGNAGNRVYYFNDIDPLNQANWSSGCSDNEIILDANICGSNDQTPGMPNNAANAAYIAQFNNNCSIITPIVSSAVVDNNEICGCDGQATATGAGSIPGYTYEWQDATNTPIGQTGATAIGLCAGTYYVVVTSSIGCSDVSSVVISPGAALPTVMDPADQSLCATTSTTAVTFTGNNGSTVYNWTNDNVTIGLGAIGTGNIASFTALNSGSTTVVSTITVTPTLGSCIGASQTFTITVNPLPTVTDPTDQTLCANTATTAVTFTGNSGSTVYNWLNDNTATGLAASGTGNIASYTATNVGSTAIMSTITVTPTLGTCIGTPQTFTITVNPVPTVTDPTDQALCANTATTVVTYTGNSGSTIYNWLNDNTATGLAASGAGNIASFTATNAGATAIMSTITVTPTLGTCIGTPQTFTITVNPVPTVTDPTDQALCANTATTAVTFTGNSGSTVYNWLNDNTATGLAASGTGNIASFTATNAGATAIMSTITVTPTLGTCIGTPQTFTITVNPVPTVTDPTDQALCANTATTAVTFTGNSGSTTYNWTNDNTATGLGASGSVNIASFTATNAGATAIMSTITVTPTLGTCVGTPQTFTITVNPIPSFSTAFTNPSACGMSDGTITLSGLVASTGYSLSYSDDGTPVGPLAITSNAGGTFVITGLNAGGYSNIMISNGSCNSLPASVSLSDPSSPVFTISLLSNPTTCLGTDGSIHIEGTGTLAASTVYSLTYVDGGTSVGPVSITTDVNGDYNITGLNAGTYTSVVLNLGGCIGSQPGPITLVDPAPPVLTITNPAAVCSPLTVDITAAAVTAGSTGVGTLSYWNDAGATSAIASPAAMATSGTFYIQATNAGCTDIDPVVVTINPTPNLVITNPAAVCTPLTVNITAAAVTAGSTNVGTLSYWNDAGATSALASPSAVATSGTYYIQASNTGCTDINPVVVTINPTPNLVITNPAAVCSPLTVDLTAAAVTAGSTNVGTLSYWNDAGATSALASPAAVATSGTYYIQATNAGCTDINSVVVTINPTPNLVITNPAAVCTPLTVNITAAAVTAGSTNVGTLSYWNDAGATSALASPLAITTSGTYYIQSSNTGCTDINPVVVTINATPNLVITNPAAVCSPLTVDITAAAVTAGSTNVGTLSYWNDAGATSALASPAAVATSGTYYIQATNAGCTDINSVVVTINPTPNLVITNPAAVCTPLTVNITAAAVTAGSTNVGTLSYWNDAGATSALASPSAITTSGTYYIQATNAGCTDIAAVVVDIVTTPNLVITNPATVCSPSTVDITAAAVTAGSTGAGTLSYWTDAGATSALATPSAVGTSGTYYILSGASGCSDIEPVTVTINQTPNLVITNPAAVCSPSTVNITAAAVTTGSTNVGTLSYWNDAGATSALASPSAVATSGTYYIQATNAGCTDINAVVVTINATPSFTLLGVDPTICNASDGSVTISGLTNSTAYSVSYDDDGTGVGPLALNSDASGNILISGLNAGTYDNFIVSLGTCTGSSAAVINLNNPGAPVITDLADQTVCNTYTLPVITGTGLSGNEGYWTATGGTGTQLVAGSAVTTTQTVYIYDINGMCSDEETVLVTVNNTPTITNPGAQTACASYTLPAITGSNLSGNEAYYNNSQALGGTVNSGSVSSSQTVWIYDAEGSCSDETSFTVTIDPLPTVTSVTGGGTYCTGDPINDIMVAVTGSANWTVDYTLNGSAMTATGSASPITLGNAPGVYVVTNITDVNCTNTASGTQTITINPIPNAPTAGTDTTYCSSWTVVPMTAAGTGGTMTWYTDTALTTVFGSGNSITPNDANGVVTYYVTETVFGCEGPASTVTITIEDCEITVPSAFTPDADNVNDVWEIIDLDYIYTENVVMVFNRWGAKLYESDKGNYASRPWDGTFEGNALPVGSYYFIIDFNLEDVNPMKGIVSIILE